MLPEESSCWLMRPTFVINTAKQPGTLNHLTPRSSAACDYVKKQNKTKPPTTLRNIQNFSR